MITVVYIAGHGRSGSTLLNSMIAHWTTGAGVGEIAHVTRASQACRCHDDACPIRQALASQTDDDTNRLARPLNWHSLVNPQRFAPQARAWESFLTALSQTADTNTLIDASKSARASSGRALVLSHTSHPVVIIHLIRDVGAIIAAYRRGSNVKLEAGDDPHYRFPALRAVSSWALSNLASWLLRRRATRAHHISLRYADLFTVAGRQRLIDGLSDAQVTITTNDAERETFDVYPHQTLGNRLASQDTFTLTLDDRWRRG